MVKKISCEGSFEPCNLILLLTKDDTNITFDANHEMAGKELNFHIELVEVK